MKIENITIRGFRCFDLVGETINLDEFSCFVGPNASGKTSAMMALVRLFGESSSLRQIVPTDFHLEVGEELKSKNTRSLQIECRLSFPELYEVDSDLSAIPEVFNQMIVEEPGGVPYCRLRLDATWTNDGTPAGDVEQSLYWILTNSEDPEAIKENRRKVQPSDRGKIRVVYIPATRDPNLQLRVTTGTSFGRLLNALDLERVDQALKEELLILKKELEGLNGVQTLNETIQRSWKKLYDGYVAQNVTLQAFEEDPSALIKLITPRFYSGEDGCSISADELSDGMRSLFSLSLFISLYQIEELLRSSATEVGFKKELADSLPILTLFAVEEPENHLSPHYLGRIINELLNIAKHEKAQVVISSHSPSILRRIEPDNVRYFLGHERTSATHVKPIPLPTDPSDETFKYVREAVRGYPELYFSRLVILGEGPTEEIVLRRFFDAIGAPLDTQFISVVPLGGRHVNHFWRLLHGLEIPFITLLDLDREKEGAGWGRVQYVRDQLVLRYGADNEALEVQVKGKVRNLSEPDFGNVCKKSDKNVEEMESWLKYFAEKFDVFFSAPLDMDFAMLEAFKEEYKALAPPPNGPRLPNSNEPNYMDIIKQRMIQVLASDVSEAPEGLGETYNEEQQKLFAWYKYFFIDGSKPVTHMRALLTIDNERIIEYAPECLKNIAQRAKEILGTKEVGQKCH